MNGKPLTRNISSLVSHVAIQSIWPDSGPITALPKMLDKWEEQMGDDFHEGGCK